MENEKPDMDLSPVELPAALNSSSVVWQWLAGQLLEQNFSDQCLPMTRSASRYIED
jgi:hypothetical protein